MEKRTNDNLNKNDKYIYFTITFDKFKKLKVYLSPEYKGFNTLEKIHDISLDVENGFLSLEVYRFKIIEEELNLNIEHKDYHIPVNVESENEKYQYVIKLKNLKKDFYEYNFEIKKLNILLFDYRKQFEIYVDILRNKYLKEQNSPENEDLILSAQSLLTGKDKKYNFLFYLSILLQCFSTKYINRHLLIFKPEKIIKFGDVEKKKLKQIKNELNMLVANPERIYIEKEKDKQKTIESFYSVVLYFNLHFQKEKVKEMFEKEQYSEYLYEKFIKFGNFFEGLILPRKDVINLIKMSDNYNQVLNLLFYLGKDVIQFLEVINEEKEYIETLYQKEKEKKEIPFIEVSKYVYPKKEDNIKMLSSIIYELNLYKQVNKLAFIKFSNFFIEEYIEFNNNVNYNNLIYIRNIVQYSNFFHELNYNKINLAELNIKGNYNCKYILDKMIHITGLKLIKNGKIKNMEILNFIQLDIYILDKSFSKKKYRPLEVFDGIDISLMGIEDKNKFFNLWKKCNFYLMFEAQLDEFYKKMASLIKEMKDFTYLFKLYESEQEKSLRYEVVKILQIKFIELLPTYKEKECPNFIENVVDLIFLSDQKKVDVKKFLSKIIEKNANENSICNIYTNLVKKHQDLSKECEQKIIKFLTDHKENSNPISLAYLIERCNIKKDLLSIINKYILNHDEIFGKEETNNYIFLRELVERKILEKVKDKKQEYYNQTMINLLKIKNFQIKIMHIYKLFKEGKQMEEILKERISIIFQCIKGDFNEFFKILKFKANKVVEVLDNLTLINDYFIRFCPNFHSENIKNIQNMINTLQENDLNYFENHYINYYKNYESYLNEAEQVLKNEYSKFYKLIYDDTRKIYEKDDLKCLEVTNKKFNEIKNIFDENGIDKIDENILILCSNPFKEDQNQLLSEIKKLILIFRIPDDKNYDINSIKNNIILVSKRESIFNAISSIIYFIEQAGVRKGDYTYNIKNIMISFKEKNNISSLKNNESLLNTLDFDLINKENNYINILNLLNQKEEIIRFLFNINIQDCKVLKKTLSEKNNKFVTINDLLDMEKCIIFFNSIGKLDYLKLKNDQEIIKLFKEYASKPENENIINNFRRFVEKYKRIKELKPSLFESAIKKEKQYEDGFISRKLDYQKIDNKFLIKKYDMDKENINNINILKNDRNNILPSNKIRLSSILDIFKIDNNKNLINSKVFHDKEEDQDLNEIISKLEYDLKKEKEINNELGSKIKELESKLKDKEKKINEIKIENNNLFKKISDLENNISTKKKEVIELLEKLKKKDEEIKKLKEKLPFEYTKEDTIFTVTISSINEDIHYSMICKNSDKFKRLENSFYENFPEYKNNNNIFLIQDKQISKDDSLEANNIRDNDVIVFKTKVNEEK